MQLPYGTLSASYRGPRDLREVGEGLGKERLTGYLRVSAFEKGGVCEYVVVYAAGKPVMAFASVGAADRKDPDSRLMTAAIGRDNAIVEVCQLQDKQVKLLQDLYREFAVTPAPAAPAPLVKAAPKESPREAPREAPRAALGATPRPEDRPRPAQAPEVRGRFVRAEEIGSLDDYMLRHPGETGHLLLMIPRNGRAEEEHVILIRGKIEAAYNAATSGPGLWQDLRASPGQAEFYAVDEALLTSIIGRYTRATSARPAEPQATGPAQPQVIRPAAVVGIPARDLLEGPRRVTPPVWDDGGPGTGDGDGGIEDDIAMVRKVEHDFAGHVDELLSKLELSHLRSRKKRV